MLIRSFFKQSSYDKISLKSLKSDKYNYWILTIFFFLVLLPAPLSADDSNLEVVDTPTLAIAFDNINFSEAECYRNTDIVLTEMEFTVSRNKNNSFWAIKDPYRAFVLCKCKEKIIFIVVVGPKGKEDKCKQKANSILNKITQ